MSQSKNRNIEIWIVSILQPSHEASAVAQGLWRDMMARHGGLTCRLSSFPTRLRTNVRALVYQSSSSTSQLRQNHFKDLRI